jgi:hypothetical protein
MVVIDQGQSQDQMIQLYHRGADSKRHLRPGFFESVKATFYYSAERKLDIFFTRPHNISKMTI